MAWNRIRNMVNAQVISGLPVHVRVIHMDQKTFAFSFNLTTSEKQHLLDGISSD